jgi:flagellar hook protein FlgE
VINGQRGFQMDSKTIRTSDQMLRDLVSLKRWPR